MHDEAADAAEFGSRCHTLTADYPHDADIWLYLAASHAATLDEQVRALRLQVLTRDAGLPTIPGKAWLGEQRRVCLIDRAVRGEGMNWQSGSALLATAACWSNAGTRTPPEPTRGNHTPRIMPGSASTCDHQVLPVDEEG